ncbi:hypothetical protein GGF43_001381 [Coemansia sp. RSA 2618]|nr:hypothetical protein GGF43_001381 [Coemansia sp. RSA 2618]
MHATKSSNTPLTLKRSVRISFWLITTCYMATGVAALAAAGYFKSSDDASRHTVIVTDNVLNALLAAGAYTVASALIGIFGSLSPLTRKSWIIAYTWLLVLTMLVETGIGMWMWTRTLDAHGMYGYNWRHLWPDSVRRIFQDKNGCCGYLSPLDSPVLGSRACENAVPRAFGCMVAVQSYAQSYLTYIYTWLFGFVFIDVVALLAAMVLLTIRNDEERLRWSRANAIFRTLKKAKSSVALDIREPKKITPLPALKQKHTALNVYALM